jgi:ABC-type branched-subunit amino acid transport system substrate-binding protein
MQPFATGVGARNKAVDMANSSALLLCLVAAFAVVATSEPLQNPPDFTINNPGAKTTIKIGCTLPFSGDNGVKGVAAHNGIKMALTEFAAKNKGYNFVLTCMDSQCLPEGAKAAATALKSRGVVGVIGDICSAASIAAKDVLAPILQISPTSSSSKLSIAGDNFFRVGAWRAVLASGPLLGAAYYALPFSCCCSCCC